MRNADEYDRVLYDYMDEAASIAQSIDLDELIANESERIFREDIKENYDAMVKEYALTRAEAGDLRDKLMDAITQGLNFTIRRSGFSRR